jgi:ferrous iron transport protein A
MKKLTDILPGQVAVIEEYCNDELSIKLMEMGCVPGERIRIDKIAPFGDPISVYVAGYHLSLRLAEAERILVTEL